MVTIRRESPWLPEGIGARPDRGGVAGSLRQPAAWVRQRCPHRGGVGGPRRPMSPVGFRAECWPGGRVRLCRGPARPPRRLGLPTPGCRSAAPRRPRSFPTADGVCQHRRPPDSYPHPIPELSRRSNTMKHHPAVLPLAVPSKEEEKRVSAGDRRHRRVQCFCLHGLQPGFG